MPTSRYEGYVTINEPESKEQIVGEARLEQEIGAIALDAVLEED